MLCNTLEWFAVVFGFGSGSSFCVLVTDFGAVSKLNSALYRPTSATRAARKQSRARYSPLLTWRSASRTRTPSFPPAWASAIGRACPCAGCPRADAGAKSETFLMQNFNELLHSARSSQHLRGLGELHCVRFARALPLVINFDTRARTLAPSLQVSGILLKVYFLFLKHNFRIFFCCHFYRC